MPEMPQIQETQPVLNVQEVNSEASSYEAFGKVLGQLSDVAEKKMEDVESEQSKAMYIHSVSNIEQLKTTSAMRLLETPGDAQRIADDMQSATDQVKQMAFVNREDRAKLNAYADSASDDIALKSVETRVKQTRLMSAFTHYANWPDQLKAYQDALISGNEEEANNLQEAMTSTLKGLVQTGALTPEQAGSGIKTMHDITEVASDHLQMFANENTTARDYHTITSNPLNPNQTGNVNTPVNESSRWMTDYYNNDKSFRGVLSSINRGMLPNPEVFDSLPRAQRQHAILAMQGTRMAQGVINSGEPLPYIQKTYEELSRPGRLLDYREKAMKDNLEMYLSDLKNGDYLSVIGRTPMGGQIMQDFVSRDAAIQNLPVDDAKKIQMLTENKNLMVSRAVAYGQAHGFTGSEIKPLSAGELGVMQSGFKALGDPSNVLKVLGQYDKANQAYIANSLKEPKERLIAQTLSYAGNGVSPQDQLDLISANQDGISYHNIKYDSQGLNDGKLRARIQANLKDQTGYLARQYNGEDALSFQGSMIESTLNLAKFYATKNNDLGMKDWSKWVDKASGIYKNAFEKVSNTNYVVNPKQLPESLSMTDLDLLADYAVNQGYNNLRGGATPSIFDTMTSRNPLHMRFSPTNEVEAVDQNGSVYFREPYNSNLIHIAKADIENRKKQQEEENLKIKKVQLTTGPSIR